ncbi:MAG: hypothetical protein GY793_08045 [Proteobacteria bacterium]|nr:hypothetical protein [Pseudomonadota bacterium]
MKFSKKAAMFGLDARVALAIFGALSVITGAALYNALQEAKVVAIITEMNNIDKAFTAYLLDVGTYPAEAATTINGELKAEELITSTVAGWKGPYTSFQDIGTVTDGWLDHPTFGPFSRILTLRKINTPWEAPGAPSTKCLSTSDSCSIYICCNKISVDILKQLDLKLDGTSSPSTGIFRYGSSENWGCKQGMTYDKSLAPSS